MVLTACLLASDMECRRMSSPEWQTPGAAAALLLRLAPADFIACRQVVDLPADLFAEASAARLLLGALPARAGAAPYPDPDAAAPVAAPLLLPAGAEVGSGLVAEVLGLLASGRADLRVQVC